MDDVMEKGLQISLVPPQFLGQVWDQCETHLTKAVDLSGNRYRMEDLRNKVATGEFQLWIVFDEARKIVAVTTTMFNHYPSGEKSLFGQFLGGKRLPEWQHEMCETLARWADDHQCHFIEFCGRPGWGRLLAPEGYFEEYRTYRRNLIHGRR